VEDVAVSCDRLAILHHGRIRFCGSPGELIEKFAGLVYELEVPEVSVKEKLLTLGERVLTTHRRDARRAIRVLGQVPGARPVLPSLEDAYLALIRS
ncbi:MAG: ABC transporter ATP-binding protein, partial [Candidatus Bipolaricaulaceae bacterium]